MNLLLDTHMLLWWLAGHRRLSSCARGAIRDADSVYVSAVSAWEIGIKAALGKLVFDSDVEEQIASNGFRELPITVRHAAAASRLPRHHHDLFDRMLVAQAETESLKLLTADAQLKAYGAMVMLA